MTIRLPDADGNPRAAWTRNSRVVGSPLPASLKAGSAGAPVGIGVGIPLLMVIDMEVWYNK